MNSRMFDIAQRRGELLARIAVQRNELASSAAILKAPLAVADQGLRVVRFLRSKPLFTAAVIALVLIRRRNVFFLIASGFRVWRVYRSAASYSTKLTSYFRRP